MAFLNSDDKDRKKMETTQISIGGFGENVKISAKEVADFLDREMGIVLRCRLKNSSTPQDTYPNYEITDFSDHFKIKDYAKVMPHAFVHFLRPEGAKKTIDAAENNELIFNNRCLTVMSGTNSAFQIRRRKTTDPFKFLDVNVDIGTMVSQQEFWVGWKGPGCGVDFFIDPFQDSCQFFFNKNVAFQMKGTKKAVVLKCNMKIEFFVREIDEIRIFKQQAPMEVILHLTSSPRIYYRTADDDIHISSHLNLLDDEDPWIRTTDFTKNGAICRCSSYKISTSPRFRSKLNNAVDYLKQRRISQYIPNCLLQVKDEPRYEWYPSDLFFSLQHKEGISFETMYLVNALLNKGIVKQHHMTDGFFDLLKSQPDYVNSAALRHIYSYKRSLFDASTRLKTVQRWLLMNPKLLKDTKISDGNMEVRRLVITPTKAYCIPPEVELSNRVLRMYKRISNRFLRVTFADEGMQQLTSNTLNYYVSPIVQHLTSNRFPQKTTVYQRVKDIMADGFTLCGRRYSFLAFSANQLRDQSAWFVAECKKNTVDSIFNWMGKFNNRNVAKYSARTGQCFSSTYSTVNVPVEKINREIKDITKNGYNFSDGIGKIDPELAIKVAEKMNLRDDPPSAYQIRFAGCKGVVAVWPSNGDGYQIHLRPSMNKFDSNHNIIEVVSWTRFQPCFLNRQIVTLLSALYVPDIIFSKMQDSMVSKLDQMLVDPDVAFDIITSSCAEQGNTAAMMLSAGFIPQTEPYLKAMLSCLRSAQLRDLLTKTRIFVPLGRWLMGCLDESAVLQSGQCFIQVSTPSLERCFLKHGLRFSDTKKIKQVIKGTVIIAKNPCLHPGDIRILKAIDVPGLHHLVDCLVFPQKGQRPHTNEASGSDLDGDLYFVSWDENLIPPSRRSWNPMDYTPSEAQPLPRDVTRRDIVDFFARNMANTNLGVICNAHVVHSDLSEYGALDENCIKLAELAADAVDFPKTGKNVKMPQDLRPKIYPDFMGKQDFISYKSEKIMGKLYRKIKEASEGDPLSELYVTKDNIPYDFDLEIPGSSDFLLDSWHHKCTYDAQMNALLGQYNVQFEGEVVTGHFWSLLKSNSRKQGDLKDKIKNAYSSIHKEFRKIFESTDGYSSSPLTDDEICAILEQKASAWYQVTYNCHWLDKINELKEPDGEEMPILLSFPWIATDYLVRIKVRSRLENNKKLYSKKPLDSLASYLADKI